ncbi:MAG: hypothetical protein PHX14_09175 [Syntrophomonadaceae bacterium]|nr:hypothetical protein [Syntrophomonadaceae bacterium]
MVKRGSTNLSKSGRWVVGRSTAGKRRIHSSRVVVVQLDRSEELKAMKVYRRNVTKSPEAAKAFLTRIGAFEIK